MKTSTPIAICAVSVAVASYVSAQEIAIVHPPEFENMEGDQASGTGANAGRMQVLLQGGAHFAGLPDTHRTLTGFRWRPDSSVSSPESHIWNDFELRVSTTSQSLDDMSTRFSENIGPDELLVLEGPITTATMNEGPRAGPKEFDIAFDFDTPFHYDPTAGNLLLDFAWGTPWVSIRVDSCCASPDGPGRWIGSASGNPNVEIATLGGHASGYQLIFVPEPSSVSLMVISFLGLIQLRQRKQSCY